MTVLVGRSVDGGGTYRAVTEALARLLRARRASTTPRCGPTARRCAGCCPACRTSRSAADARPTPRSCSAKACSRCWPGGARCSCWRTCTGPTRTRSTSCATSRARWSTRPCCWWRRPATTSPSPASPRLAADVRTLPLHRLDADGVAALAAACRGAPLPAAERDELVARADGLPLLVEELLAVGPTRVPPSMAGLVAGRLAALPPSARQVVLAAAVVGDTDWRLLAAIAAPDRRRWLRRGPRPARRRPARRWRSARAELAAHNGPRETKPPSSALRAAADVGLLVVADGALRFRHALTRDAVLATLLPPERAALAARAARVLDARGDRAVAARLYRRVRRPGPGGGDPRRAGPRGRRPGRRAQRRRLPRRGGRARRARRARARADPARPRRRGAGDRRARSSTACAVRNAPSCACGSRAPRSSPGGWADARRHVESAGRPDDPRAWCSSPTPPTARATSRRPSGSPGPPPTPPAIPHCSARRCRCWAAARSRPIPRRPTRCSGASPGSPPSTGCRPGGCRPCSGWAATSTPTATRPRPRSPPRGSWRWRRACSSSSCRRT